MEKWYEVKQSGVVPCLVNPEELRKSHSWMIAHDFNGRLIFENYSRAMLCWHERKDNKYWPLPVN